MGKLSDVIKAVANANIEGGKLNAFCTVVDACKCKMYMKNFGEFFNDQVENASCIILSHTSKATAEKLATAVALLKEKNDKAGFKLFCVGCDPVLYYYIQMRNAI